MGYADLRAGTTAVRIIAIRIIVFIAMINLYLLAFPFWMNKRGLHGSRKQYDFHGAIGTVF